MKGTAALLVGIAALVALAVFFASLWFGSETPLIEKASVATSSPGTKGATIACLPSGDGFLRARLDGALDLKLDWSNSDTQCEGMPRPDGNGVRLSFSRAVDAPQRRLVIVFGIAGLSESSSGHALPANLTIIEEGRGRVYGTLGDDKCVVDDLSQQLITPWRPESRTYRISGRGFCLQPARTVGEGDASVLMSTFDFAGQIIYSNHDAPTSGTRAI